MTTMLSSLLNMTIGLAMVGMAAKSFKTLDTFLNIGTSDIVWRLQRDEKTLNEYIEKLKRSPTPLALGMTAEVMLSLESTYRRLIPVAEKQGFANLAGAFRDMEALCDDAYHVFDRASTGYYISEGKMKHLSAGWQELPLIEFFDKDFVERVFNELVKARDSISRATDRTIFLYSQSAQSYSALDLARDIAELHSLLIPVIKEKLKL
jgi:hypothetical protein